MAISKDEVAKLAASGGRGQLEARMRILRDPAGYCAGTLDPTPVAPAAPVSNPPGGAPASAPFNVRAEVERLAKSADGRDQVLARVGILNHTEAYVESFKPADATTIELAQAQLDARVAKAKAAGTAEGEAALAKELGVASMAEARRLLGVAPVAPEGGAK